MTVVGRRRALAPPSRAAPMRFRVAAVVAIVRKQSGAVASAAGEFVFRNCRGGDLVAAARGVGRDPPPLILNPNL